MSASVSMCARAATSVCPRKTGRWSRNATATSSSYTTCAGADLVPISWRAKDDEITYLLEDSKAELLVAEEGVSAEIPVLHYGDAYETALRAENDEPLPGSPPIAPPSIRFYTSGTTGRPKAVERPRSTVDNYLAAAREHLGIFHVEQPGDVH